MNQYQHIFTYAGIYEFLAGPVFVISVICFVAGFVFQIGRFFQATVKVERPASKGARSRRGIRRIRRNPPSFLLDLRHTLWGHWPVMAIFTTVFHILVIVTPVFLMAHNVLLKEATGFYLPFFSETVTDACTVIILLSGLMFLARRLFFQNVRAVTAGSDLVLLAVVLFPYLSGFLLYHQLLEFNRLLMLIHMASGELMLVCLPFTKLVHFLYFFFNRFLMTSEHSIIRGTREWKGGGNEYPSIRAGG